MRERRLILALAVLLAAGLVPLTAADADSAYLVRLGIGLDVMDLGLAVGAGGGYRFAGPTGSMEIMADVFYSPYWETYTEGLNTFDYSTTLIIVAVRADWLLNYQPDRPGLYPLIGAGLFAGSYSWKNYNQTTGYTEGNDYFASGAVVNLGLGWAFNRRLEARLEVPVLVFFGIYGRTVIAIPITLSGLLSL